ncbi:hypothetical protein LEP1GSC018_2451 [Leptospira kirschneri str. 2008720114]|uniref:hypothetical protein n=1 Tax=Leptospira kirschneri TaxID=29507 RepID=UPI0002985045|nr:hypothetical protein LEP1GSC018_2451 [Leptospira kirschneri str. 2008720114]
MHSILLARAKERGPAAANSSNLSYAKLHWIGVSRYCISALLYISEQSRISQKFANHLDAQFS